MPDVLEQNDVLSAGYQSPVAASNPQEAAKIKADQERQKQEEQQFDRANKMREQQIGMAQKALATQEQGLKAEQPMRESVIKASQDVSAAAKNRPELEKMPAAPQKAAPDETWLSTAGLIGAIAGALTRQHATNALAAFTGVINGLSERDEDKFKSELKTWEAESKRVQDTNKQRLTAYQDILDSAKIDMDQKMVALQMESKKWGDQATFQMAASKQYGQIADSMDYQTTQQIKLQESRDALLQKAQQFQQSQDQKLLIAQMRAIGVNKPEDMQATIDAIGRYERAPIPGVRGTGIMNEVSKQYPDYKDTEYFKRRNAMRIEGGAFNTQKYAQTVSQNAVIDHLDTLRQLGQSLQGGDITILNRIKQKIADETGSPVPPTFDAAKNIIGTEIAKAIMQAGAGGVTDRDEIKATIDRAKSPQQIDAVSNLYQRLISAQMKANARLYKTSTGQDLGESELLSPKAKMLLKTPDDPVVFNHSELQKNINEIFSNVQGGAGTLATEISKGANQSTTGFGDYMHDVINRAKQKGWSLEPLQDQKQPLIGGQ